MNTEQLLSEVEEHKETIATLTAQLEMESSARANATAEVETLRAQNKRLREALEGISGVLTTMNQNYKPEQIFELLNRWNEQARDALMETETAEDEPERHHFGCVCADCSGAELTAEND